MVQKPEIIDCFRLNRGKVFKDVENSRTFKPNLWNRMWKGDFFDFDWERGMRKLPDFDRYEFPMQEYLLSHTKGIPLKQILGPNVKIVTQKTLLRDLMYMLINPKYMACTNHFLFERFGDVLFVKGVQSNRSFDFTDWDIYLDRRRQFFNGDDLPGCIGSKPVEEFDFPDVGKSYRVLSLKRRNSRILYSCAVNNFSPDGEPVDSVLSRNSFFPSKSKENSMLLNAATGGFKHYMFFKLKDGKAQMEFCDTERALREKPHFYEALDTALDLLLDERILKFLANRRGCKATLEYEPELRLKLDDFPPDYKSFLTSEFFMRFYDDDD